MILSFAFTTPALLAGRKTVTRRDWTNTHAEKFRAGQLVDAYDRSPRYKGRKVATIRITQDPYRQMSARMPDADYEREGFAFLDELKVPVTVGVVSLTGGGSVASWREAFERWRRSGGEHWVLEFQLVEVVR